MNTAAHVRAIIAEVAGLRPEDVQDADGLAYDLMLYDLGFLAAQLWLSTEIEWPPSHEEMQKCLFVRDVIEMMETKLEKLK